MNTKKNKIWIISIILINLIFIVFQNNYKIENTAFKDNPYGGYNDNLSNLHSSYIDWYNADWQYRKVINITTGSAAVPSDYSVSLTFNHASLVSMGKSRADGNDIRVVYNSGSDWEELDRILDPGSSWENDSTMIWFKTQALIPAFSSDNNYFLYYGNLLADLPPSNSSNIFFFYDGFESGDFSAWDYLYEGGGDTINVVSSPVHTGTSAAEAYVDNVGVGQTYVETQFNGERTFHSVVYTYIPSSWSGAQYIAHIQYYGMYNENSEQVGSITIADNLEPYVQIWDPENATYYFYFGNTPLTTNEWHRLEIKLILSSTNISLDGRVELWQDGVQTVNESEVYMPHDYISSKDVGIYWDQSAEETIYIDDCFDKLWINPEPISTLCTEEKFRPSISDFKYYKEITIDHTKVSGTSDLSNFPVLISIFDLDLHDHAQPDGDDIAFYNGTDWLFHEIEVFNQCYNSTHAQLVAWVRIPSLSCTVDTIITMYYGNSTIGPQEYPDRVWDSDYKGVWHLEEDPSVSKIKDSTINSYDGTSYGSMTSSDQIKGQIGGSMKFDGLNDYINLGPASGLKLTDAFTFEAWYSGIYNGTVNTRSPIFTNGFSYTNNIGIRVEAFHSTAGETNREARIAVGDGSNFNYLIADYEINDNTWTYLACTYDGSTLKLYINGTKQIDELNTNIAYNTNNATIGRNLNNIEQWYKGQVDELRFLAKNCSAEWIATEYNNQYDPNSFYSIGTEQTTLAHNANYFAYYKVITINSIKVSGSSGLINFPFLLSIFDSDLHDHAQVGGDDIAFYSGGKWLDHEIELFNRSYSGTQAQLVTWIRIPFLSSSTDTNITMYYGNSTMGSQENPNGVWDPNFVGVWHLDESGTGAVNEYVDSGHYGNNGQGGSGNVSYIPDRTVGAIGFGQDFVDNFIDCGNATSLDITTNQITMQLWMKYPATHPWMGPFNHKGYNEGYRLVMDENSQYLNFQLPGDERDLQTSQTISTNEWHYVVATYNGSLMRIYVDGVSDPASLTKLNNIESALPYPFRIGHGDHPEGQAWTYPWLGQIDEVRISNIGRSADWIATEYNNQYSPETFSILSAEHAVSEVPPNSEFFNYYKVLTVDHTKVNGSGSHTNFPLLISILDEDLHDHVLSGGNDIAFAIGNEWLDHEIELFNQTYSSTQAQLIAWVRIPSLSTSIDTKITMYYGNSTMESQENPMGVWNSGYVGIWHLSEDPTGTIYDSTLNNNDGTTYGSMNSGDQISGKIDGSIEFDGYDDYIDCGNNNSLDITGDITIEFWVNGISFLSGLDPDILTKGDYTHAYSTWINDDGGIYFELNHDSLISTTKLSLGEWHHVVCVRSGSNRIIYINGSEDISDSFSSAIETITDTLTIARSPDNLNGSLDEIRLSNVARSAEWIATEYNNLYDPTNFYSIGIENQIGADTSAPDITINSPNSNELFGLSAPNYNLTVIDANLDSIWYSLNGGANSTPVSASGVVDETMWDALGNGTVTIRFYANDTIGNLNYEEVTVRKDIVNPSIIINSPSSGSNHSSPPSYSLSITEANIDEIWYTLDEGLTNYTGAQSGTIDSTAWSNAGQGSVTITFYVNDSAGNWDSASVGINRDSIDPSIDSIDSPSSGAWFASIPPGYSLSITETNLDEIWYTLDGGLTNYTGAQSGTIDSTAWSNAGQGSITITFYVNDSAGNWHSASVGINRDTIDPSIDSIDSPSSGAWFASNPPGYSLSITETNLDEIWYTLDGGLTNYTGAQSGTIDSTAWSNAGQGSITITFYVNDSAGNWHSASVGINRDTIDPSIDSIDLPLPVSNHSAPPSYSLSITESNLDTIWYTLDGGLTNYTGALSGTIDSIAWGNAGLGAVTITFYVNDSVNNWDSASVVITKTSDLTISINSPNMAQWFSSIPDYDVYVSGNDRDSIWYTLDNGLTNFTITSTASLSNTWLGLIDSTAWSNAGQGSVTITFYLNNTFGIIVSASVGINRDTIDPSIDNIDSPLSGAWFASIPPSYSLSITETNLDTIWYTLDGGLTNYTGGLSGTIDSTAWSNAGQGSVAIIFYVNDSAGNWYSANVGINRDTIDPSIDSIDSPSSGAWFASIPPGYSLSITETNLDEIWYTLDGGVTNYTGAQSGMIDSTAWSNAGQGSVTIIFYVNDSAGNWHSTSVGINRDTIDPSIDSIDLPLPDSNHSAPPSYSLSITESNLDTIWYTLDGGLTNYTGALSGTIDSIAWGNAGLGAVTITFYVNDSVNNWDSASVLITKTSDLSISINSPNMAQWFSSIPDYDVYVSGNDRDSIWYTLDNGLTNFTITSTASLSNAWLGLIDSTAWSNAGQGSVTLTFYLNNTFGIIVSASVGINRDTIDPSIDNINSPLSGAWFASISPGYSLSITETNLDTIWYTLDGGLTNYTGGLSGTIDSTAWSNAGQGNVTIIFYVNDSAGNWHSASVGINRDTIDPTINSIDSPAFGAWFNSNPPDYSLSITEANLDTIWYTLDGGLTNYTGASSGTIDSTAWSNAGEGSVTIIFYVNDSAGNWDSASVIINKDTIDPAVTIIKPNNYDHFGTTPPDITINIYDSNLDFSWYQLDNGTVITNNYTWTGFIAQSVWDQVGNGTIIIRFYANDTVGNLANAEVIVYKDIYLPIITIIDPTLNELYTDTAPSFMVSISGSNLDSTWYTLNNGGINYTFTGLTGSIDQSAWASRADGTITIKFYINNTVGMLGFDEVDVIKDTIAPSAPDLINFPQGVVDGNLLFEWNAGSDPSGILKYRLIIDNEDNPLITPGYVFETNITGTSYTFTGTLQPGMYYFFLYQIDGAGHQSQASTGSFSIRSNTSPPEFPIWIIFVVIGAAIGGVIGIIVLKKSKGKKEFIPQVPEKKPVAKIVQEVPEEISQLDYDMLSVMNHNELINREESLLERIRHLEENKNYGKAAEAIGEIILIENILGNYQEVKLYRQKQIDLAIRGLEYLKDQYEIESKKAALSGDYSKALELYNESKVISDNLKGYMEHQESSDTEEGITLETIEPEPIIGGVEIVYSCINDLLTKYFDDIGIKYYSNPQIYEDIQAQVHGLILADQFHLEDIDSLVKERLKSIQIIFTEDISNATVTNLCQTFHNPDALLIIVGIKWPVNVEAQIIEIPPNLGDQYQENIRIIHFELFMTLMGLTGAYETAFKEIIDLYNKSEINILRDTQESSEIIIHSTDELRYDLKEKGLITDQLGEYFNR